MGEESNISKAQNLHGKRLCICGRYKCEGVCALPGEVSGKFFFREVSRRHSSSDDYRNEGQNLELRLMELLLTELDLVAGVDVETHLAHCEGTVRKTGEQQ